MAECSKSTSGRASTSALRRVQALVVLGSLGELHARVDIDEHDIPRFKPGAPARGTLKGQPQHAFSLSFVRVEPFVIPKRSLTGDTTERVDTRVLQVIYRVDATDQQNSLFAPSKRVAFYVGQQLDVSSLSRMARGPPTRCR